MGSDDLPCGLGTVFPPRSEQRRVASASVAQSPLRTAASRRLSVDRNQLDVLADHSSRQLRAAPASASSTSGESVKRNCCAACRPRRFEDRLRGWGSSTSTSVAVHRRLLAVGIRKATPSHGQFRPRRAQAAKRLDPSVGRERRVRRGSRRTAPPRKSSGASCVSSSSCATFRCASASGRFGGLRRIEREQPAPASMCFLHHSRIAPADFVELWPRPATRIRPPS